MFLFSQRFSVGYPTVLLPPKKKCEKETKKFSLSESLSSLGNQKNRRETSIVKITAAATFLTFSFLFSLFRPVIIFSFFF